MTIPEKSINLALDSSAVALQQHQPTADETGEFRDLCEAVSKLAMEIFEPTNTQRTGIACTSVRSFSSDEAVLKASRAVVAANGSTPISEWIDMPLSQVELNERYRSGSRELVVRTQPVTFVNRPLATETPGFSATSAQRRRAARFNEAAARSKPLPEGYALQLVVDLMESDPVETEFGKLFDAMLNYRAAIEAGIELIYP